MKKGLPVTTHGKYVLTSRHFTRVPNATILAWCQPVSWLNCKQEREETNPRPWSGYVRELSLDFTWSSEGPTPEEYFSLLVTDLDVDPSLSGGPWFINHGTNNSLRCLPALMSQPRYQRLLGKSPSLSSRRWHATNQASGALSAARRHKGIRQPLVNPCQREMGAYLPQSPIEGVSKT